MANNQVSVEITLEEKAALKALTQLTKEIQKTEGSFNKMGVEGDKSLGSINQATSGVTNSFKSLIGGVTVANLASTAILNVANGLKSFVLDSINAAVEQEQATTRLGQALRATGSFSQAAVDDLSEYANALSLVTKFSDDAIINQLAVAKSFGATNKEAKDLVLAASNLAATFGGSLESNVEKLGKTFSGSAGKLAQFIPELKALTKEQLIAGDTVDIVNGKFAGAASSELETYAGRIGQLTKAFGEFQEAIGTIAINSGITEYFQTYGQVLQDVNRYMSDSAIESARQKEGFTETASSIEQLTRKMNELKVEAIDAEQIVNNPSFFDTLLARPQAAAENIKRLNLEISAMQATIDKANASRAPQAEEQEEAKRSSPIDPTIEAKAIEQRNATYAQLEIARADFNARQIEQSVLEQEITEQNYAFELERLNSAEQMKIEALFAAEEQKAMLISDAKSKQFALQKIAIDKEMALQKSSVDTKKKLDTQQVALEQQKQAAMAGIIGSSFTLLATLAKDGSREQFLIQKAAAVAEIAIADGKARALIPAQTALIPFPGNIPAAASLNAYVTAQTAIGLATVAAATIKGYEKGGIIPGSSYSGDNVMARVNSGEMILNRNQQSQLFNMANNGGGGEMGDKIERLITAISSQPINLSVDGRALATVIRGEVRAGFKLG